HGGPSWASRGRTAPRPWLPWCFLRSGWSSATPTLLVVLLVTLERAGRSELTELVTDHRLGHEDRDVLAAVVDRQGVAEHVGGDHRPAGPGLDDVLGSGLVLRVHLLGEVVVDERALLRAARRCCLTPRRALLARP